MLAPCNICLSKTLKYIEVQKCTFSASRVNLSTNLLTIVLLVAVGGTGGSDDEEEEEDVLTDDDSVQSSFSDPESDWKTGPEMKATARFACRFIFKM